MKSKYVYTILSFTILMLFVSMLNAQNGRGQRFRQDRDRIATHKVAFITEKLDLSKEEAEKFWPVYNENQKRVEQERAEFRKSQTINLNEVSEISDTEALAFLEAQLKHEQKMLDYRKAFSEELKSVLSPQKILQLIEAEKRFREELIRQVAGRGERSGGKR